MAGGKLSPRQKMINLMYLVFIAMLALNMSKEVLKAFGLMNEKFEVVNKFSEEYNNSLFTTLETKASKAARSAFFGPIPFPGPPWPRSGAAARKAALIASACACVIVPLATSAERTEAIASSGAFAFVIGFVIPFEEVRVVFVETTLVFDDAWLIPTDPIVSATVVIATAITVFFDDICMPSFHPLEHIVETLFSTTRR